MANHRRDTAQAHIGFDALAIEGGLLAAEWLAKVAQLEAAAQSGDDYRVPKGLQLRDEIARSWRIAQACFRDLEACRAAGADPASLTERFVQGFLRDALGFTSIAACEPKTVGERIYPIRFFALGDRVPVVVAPAGIGLDKPIDELGDGRRRRSAFGLLQEYLNAETHALWGLATDGLTLRLGRDNASLTRPAWVEADLGRIFAEELYPDFAALWLLCHESRFGRVGDPVEACPLEVWREAGREAGTAARGKLRAGFEEALAILGQGFVAHPENRALREALHKGTLHREQYYGQLLRLVYRLIFLLTVEERGLLHPKTATEAARALYAEGYALRRLRDRAVRRMAHDRHTDLWEAVKIVFRGLATGEPRLGLPALAGLFAKNQCPDLDTARLENRALLGAIFKLAWLREPAGLVRVNWRDMGPDELGYVYEGLLELVPQITEDGRSFAFAGADESRGHTRKTTGSYYTPDELVQLLLDSALDPVALRTVQAHPDRPADALLELAIVDPACGSGHFLFAAARRLADHVARIRAAGTPTPEDFQRALRDVVRRCIYGVDLNPLAVELCKVSLWMESIDPGLPLTFLESHIRHGNSLLGTTRELMGDRVPDDAWVALEGDDKKLTASIKKRNKAELAGQRLLPLGQTNGTAALEQAIEAVEQTPDTDAATLAEKEQRWRALLASQAYEHSKLVADAWCAAFLWPKDKPGPVADAAPTTAVWRSLRDKEAPPSPALVETTRKIAEQYALFHWDLAFPQVFSRGGFDIVLGNPPWEHLELKEEEFFAQREPSIARAQNAAARKKLIAALPTINPGLWIEFQTARRTFDAETHFARASGRYPLCAKGRINTYALFAEHNWRVIGPHGRAGFIVPSGIATDDTTKEYFGELASKGRLQSLYDFQSGPGLFAEIGHARFKFCLLTIGHGVPEADLVFFARAVSEVDDPDRHFTLSAEDFALLNPNTRTCPTFRSRRDAEINLAIYRRAGVLWREGAPDGNPWGLRFMQGLFNMASDSGLFRQQGELASAGWRLEGNRFVKDGEVMLPLYEAKMVHHFDHRYGDYADKRPESQDTQLPDVPVERLVNPSYSPLSRYLVPAVEVAGKLSDRWDRGWLLGWRDICRSFDERTVIASLIPRVAVGDKFLLMMPSVEPPLAGCLYACLCSFALDYTARQKVGGTSLKYFTIKQLPVLAPSVYAVEAPWQRGVVLRDWLLPRVLELTYTAWDLKPFAEDCGESGPPFIWDPARRFQLRCELDAAFFHLYGISRDDAGYILDTFPIVRKHDEKAYGEYRTKRVVLEVYDALAEASRTGKPYVSPLGPPRRAT